MEEIVKKYLTKNNILLFSTISSYRLFDITTKDFPRLNILTDEIVTIFGISAKQFEEIWSIWVDEEIHRLNKKLDIIKSTNTEETLLNITQVNDLIKKMV